jgi:deoxycytidine triphosphate deaminase
MLLKSTLDSVALKNSSLVTLGSLSTETATLNTANGILMTTVAVRNQNAQLESSISSIEQSTYLLDSYSSQMTAMEPRLQAGDLNTVSSFSSLVDSSALEVANINTNSALISTSSSTQVSNLTTLNKSICNGKSTVARSGIQIYVTPLEAGWKGFITLEFFNSTDSPVLLTPGMGISQLNFVQGNTVCEVSYDDRGGKYQNQGPHPIPPLKKF